MKAGVYGLLFPALTCLLWPYLWESPLQNFLAAYDHFKKFPCPGTVFFQGQVWESGTLPRYYLFYMMGICCPLLHLGLFAGGFLTASLAFIRKPFSGGPKQTMMLAVLAWFALPMLIVLILNPVLYDGWRHFFFVYPAMALLMSYGLLMLWDRLTGTAAIPQKRGRGLLAALALILCVHSAWIVNKMIQWHPYESVIFNPLAGTAAQAQAKYDFEYWGISFRELLEYIVEHDVREKITVASSNDAGAYGLQIIRKEDRDRITVVDTPEEADYYISNFRFEKSIDSPGQVVFEIKREGAILAAVVKKP